MFFISLLLSIEVLSKSIQLDNLTLFPILQFLPIETFCSMVTFVPKIQSLETYDKFGVFEMI